MIDLHSHLLPGLDDGARSVQEARGMVRAAVVEGVTAIAATPHVRPDYPTTPEQMEAGVETLRTDLREQGITVDLLTGGEVELALLWELDRESLFRFSLGGSRRYLLVEVPYESWPRMLSASVPRLRGLGLTAVFAHPERNPHVQDQPELVLPLVGDGALVQVTAASVDGRLGPTSMRTAERLLELGAVHMIGSDAHGPHIRAAGMLAAAERIDDLRLREYLTVTVPGAIVAGDDVPHFE
jgi:protein-tyrosine phosphatase